MSNEEQVIAISKKGMAEIFSMFLHGEETKGIEAEYQDLEDASESQIAYAEKLAEYFFNIYNTICYQKHIEYEQSK